MRTGVEVAITDLAAERIDGDGYRPRCTTRLHARSSATDAERVEAVHDLHAAVAGAAHNRVLQLVALVLIRLSRLHQIERLAPRRHRSRSGPRCTVPTRASQRPSNAGDRELARHRMRRHLEALGALMR